VLPLNAGPATCAVGHHPVVQVGDGAAAGARKQKRYQRVYRAGHGPDRHGGGKAKGCTQMLEIEHIPEKSDHFSDKNMRQVEHMSPLKRSLTIAGHRTSLSLEPEFWDALRAIAAQNGLAPARLVEQIDKTRGSDNLSSAVRVHILKHFRTS